MCAINGILSLLPDPIISDKLKEMNDCVIHRGPDDHGSAVFDDRIALGMRRLSIIDLAHGHQPVFNDQGTMAIVFNGELYNFKDLREGLRKKGYKFKTNSDTEVLLKMYEEEGTDMFGKLNGMFAFSIYDKGKNELIIARDRVGEKPLYYHHSQHSFIWASELKSIVKIRPDLKILSRESLGMYLTLTYIPAPATIYDEIYKLEPGNYLKVNTVSLELENYSYWSPDESQPDQLENYDEAKKELRKLLFDSIEKRMISDVPLGVFLSGGVDSSIVAAVMAKISPTKISTFSVGFQNKRFDESLQAAQAARHIGSTHYATVLDYNEILEEIDPIILNYDEPYADSSALPTWFVSKHAADYVKVALTGDGGDEVFGGYNKYLLHSYNQKYRTMIPGPLRAALGILVRLRANAQSPGFFYSSQSALF